MNEKKKLEVVAAVIRDDKGKTLICQRPANKGCALLWEFPGGKIEPGETPPQALVRECREELAIGLEVGEQVAETRVESDRASIHILYFQSKIVSGRLTLLEHNDARWIVASERGSFEFCPSDSKVVDAILASAPSK